MPKIYPFIPDPQGELSWRVATDENIEFSRVPHVGEYVSLGNDTVDVHAVYQVVGVIHAAGRPNDTDAEVYLRRVEFLDIQKDLATRTVPFEIESRYFPKPWKGGVQLDSDELANMDPNTTLRNGIRHGDRRLIRDALTRFRDLGLTEGTVNAAVALAVAGDEEGAETLRRLLEQKIRLTPSQKKSAVAGLAQFYLMRQLSEEGLRKLEALIRKFASESHNEDAAFFLNQLGRLYFSSGRFDLALQAQTEAAQLQPDEPAYSYNLSLIFEQLGQDEEAATAAKWLLRSEIRDPEHLAHAIGLFLKVGDHKEASDALLRLRKLDPVRAEMLVRTNSKLRMLLPNG